MLFRIARACTVVALCVSIGAHWAALQSVAWATMLIENSQRTSLARAIEQTFDGGHPCDLCKHVMSAQHSPKKQELPAAKMKPDLICTTRRILMAPPFGQIDYIEPGAADKSRVYRPSIPPPRLELT